MVGKTYTQVQLGDKWYFFESEGAGDGTKDRFIFAGDQYAAHADWASPEEKAAYIGSGWHRSDAECWTEINAQIKARGLKTRKVQELKPSHWSKDLHDEAVFAEHYQIVA